MIRVQVPGRTFTPVTEPIEFSFDAPTWSLGKSMAAHIAMGRVGEGYHKDLKDTIYQICGCYLLSTALVFSLEVERVMQQSSVSISLSF